MSCIARSHAADAVLFVGSRGGVASHRCYIELALACSARKPNPPVAIESCVLIGLLEDRQWLELTDW